MASAGVFPSVPKYHSVTLLEKVAVMSNPAGSRSWALYWFASAIGYQKFAAGALGKFLLMLPARALPSMPGPSGANSARTVIGTGATSNPDQMSTACWKAACAAG